MIPSLASPSPCPKADSLSTIASLHLDPPTVRTDKRQGEMLSGRGFLTPSTSGLGKLSGESKSSGPAWMEPYPRGKKLLEPDNPAGNGSARGACPPLSENHALGAVSGRV